jgi:hypothetical protein
LTSAPEILRPVSAHWTLPEKRIARDDTAGMRLAKSRIARTSLVLRTAARQIGSELAVISIFSAGMGVLYAGECPTWELELVRHHFATKIDTVARGATREMQVLQNGRW